MSISSSDDLADEIRRYKELGLKESLPQNHLYPYACIELSYILRNGYSKSSKNLQSLIYQDTLLALRILPTVHTQSAISAARSLVQSAESAFPKQKGALAVKEYKRGVISFKRISRQNHVEEGGVNLLPQDVLVHILSFLDVHSVLSASAVCRSWNVATNDCQLWKSFYGTYFCPLSNIQNPEIEEQNLWYLKFQQAYTGATLRKSRSKRGYCSRCSSMVGLDAFKCSNELGIGDRDGGNHHIRHISTQQVVAYILEGLLSDPSSESDSDTEDTFVFKLWAFPSSLNDAL